MVFFGIMYMPACLVFLGFIPLWYILTSPAGNYLLSGLGGIIITAGTILELIANREMKRYKADPARGPCICSGVWKYSRHPNYNGKTPARPDAIIPRLPAECLLAPPPSPVPPPVKPVNGCALNWETTFL
jgi:hypothetical protein